MRRKIFSIWAVLGVAALIYAPSLGYDFVWDDRLMVADNLQLRQPSFIYRAFATDYWEVGADPQRSGYWRPLSAISYQLTGALFGFSPGPHRLLSVLLHLLNGYLLWRLLLPLAGGGALWVAAVFLLHSIAAEVPLFVSARPDALLFFFTLLSLLAFRRYQGGGRRRWLTAGAAASAAAAMSKEPGFLLLALAPWFLCNGERDGDAARRTRRVAGTLALLLTGLFAWRALAVGFLPQRDFFAGSAAATWLTMPRVLIHYLGLSLLPLQPAAIYDFPLSVSAADPKFWGSAMALLALAAGTVFLARRSLLARLGAGWFALMILPYLNLLPSGVLLANRYLYLALPGLLLVVLGGWQEAARRWPVCSWPRPLGVTLTLAFPLFLGLSTARWLPAWKDDGALWKQALRCNPRAVVAMNNLGNFYFGSGDCRQAGELYAAALALAPSYQEARLNLARCQFRSARWEEALRSAAAVPAEDPLAGEAADLTGSILEARGDRRGGLAWSRRAHRLAPDNFTITFNLATTLLRAGQNVEAEALYREILARDPQHLAALINLAASQVQRGAYPEALTNYRRLQRLAPDRARLYLDQAVVLLHLGRRAEALEEYRRYRQAGGEELAFEELARRAGVKTDADPGIR